MTTPSAGELPRRIPPSSRGSDARYNELYAQYMDLQRALALLIDQRHDGQVTVYDDPAFPRLVWLQSMRRGDRTDIAVVKVPD